MQSPREAGQGYWKQDPDYLKTEPGPQFTRTAFWADKPDDFASVFGADGKPDPAKESAQQKTYMSRCWLIQNHAALRTTKIFDELEHDYIQQWLQLHELTLQRAPPPAAAAPAVGGPS
jgi:hypothetical protein